MFKLLSYLREVLVMVVLSGAVAQWLSQHQKTDEKEIGSLGAFTDLLAAAPARNKPEELFHALKSGQFNDLEAGDKVTFALDMVQTFIKPGMGDVEAANVRSVFITAMAGVMFDITDMSNKSAA